MSVMVDNIEVSECALYKNGKCRSLTHLVQGEYINCNSMCDYGAYARKEQILRLQAENERLKNNIVLMKKYNGENIDELIKLREEERKLREGWHSQCEVIDDLRAENERLQNNIELMQKLIKLVLEVGIL